MSEIPAKLRCPSCGCRSFAANVSITLPARYLHGELIIPLPKDYVIENVVYTCKCGKSWSNHIPKTQDISITKRKYNKNCIKNLGKYAGDITNINKSG